MQFEQLIGRHFFLRPEVRMRHWNGDNLRIDYMAMPMVRFPLCWVGFEIKVGMDRFGSVTDAMRQAIDYQQSTIIDKRFTYGYEHRPRFVFVYNPDWNELDGCYSSWMPGVLRMVGKFNVGVVNTDRYGLKITVSDSTLWDEEWGLRGYGNTFGTAKKVGSR